MTCLHFWICLLFWNYVQTVWNYWNNETISICLLFLYYSKLFDMFDIFFKKFVMFEIMLFFVYFCYFWIIKQKYCYFWKIMFLVIVYFVRRSLVIGCLPCICKAGLRPAFFYNESCFRCLCTSSGHLLSSGARLVFVKLAFGQLSFIMNHVPGVCVPSLAISCHWVLAFYL